MIVRKSSFAELEVDPDFPALLVEYAAASAIEGMPPPKCKPETYYDLEARGSLHVWTATIEDRLIGFILVICTVLPHYSALTAASESFFVGKAHRMSGAGLRLLREAEAFADRNGAYGPLVSAPLGSSLADMLPRVGYVETNRVFFRRVERDRLPLAVVLGIPAMSDVAIEQVRRLEGEKMVEPQVKIETDDFIYAGMYVRRVFIPAGVMITGVLIKIPTVLIVQGDVVVWLGESSTRLRGHNVLTASAGRKQAFAAETDTLLTMMFATDATTTAEAERQFTDEFELLASRRDGSVPCPV